jgi:hypothetical protein
MITSRPGSAKRTGGPGETGSLILIGLDELRPTQAAVGMRAVRAKRQQLADRLHKPRKVANFLESRAFPAVRGPGSAYYIVDQHHLSLALWQNRIHHAYIRVIDDLSELSQGLFWPRMEARGQLHPYDHNGCRIDPERLPASITALRPDHYRDLAWSVREHGGFKKSQANYAEFRWADFFRQHLPEQLLCRNFEKALKRACKLARSPAAADLPGYSGGRSESGQPLTPACRH